MIIHRSAKDFNDWYKNCGGDPWGYNKSTIIKKRLFLSYNFVKKNTINNFDGNFIELGAFDGSFTLILAKQFQNAFIHCNDISIIAINAAKKKCAIYKNISYYTSDLIKLNSKSFNLQGKASVILLLECLYYLADNEKLIALNNIKLQFPDSNIIISAPITGGVYFTEKTMIALFQRAGYKLVKLKVVSFKKYNFGIKNLVAIFLSSINRYFRKYFANQVIFKFTPN